MQQPQTPPRDDALREAAAEHLRELAEALTARGFTVRLDPRSYALVARNEAAAPQDPRDPLALAYGPAGLSQRVRLAPHGTGALCWHWEWSGPTRSAPPDYQLLGPAADVEQAADRIARVIALADQSEPAPARPEPQPPQR